MPPARPKADANWSIRPQLTPTNPFSARCAVRARVMRSSAGSSPPESASDDASSRAADDDSPAPCGRSEARRPRKPRVAAPRLASAHAVPAT